MACLSSTRAIGIDPLVAGLLITPLLFVFGLVAYRMYYETFEKRGSDAGVRGIAFFFGIAFIIEVLLIMQFGVDQRSVTASYIGKAWRIGEMRIPFRLLVAFAVAVGLTILLTLYLSTYLHGTRDPRGRAGPGGAAADGRQPDQDQAMGVRYRDGRARDRGRAADDRFAGRSDARPRLYRPHLLRRGHGRARQHERHADRRHHPRRRRKRLCSPCSAPPGRRRSRLRCCSASSRSGRRVCSAGDHETRGADFWIGAVLFLAAVLA